MYVRRYVAGDWPQVIGLAKAFHAESPVHSPYPFEEARVRALLQQACKDRDWLPAVAVDGTQIVGMMLLFHMPMYFSSATEVGDLALYVPSDRRGGKAAIKLMQFGEQWANAIGADVIRLGITTGINDDSVQRFFTRLGFTLIGRQMEKRST